MIVTCLEEEMRDDGAWTSTRHNSRKDFEILADQATTISVYIFHTKNLQLKDTVIAGFRYSRRRVNELTDIASWREMAS